MKKSALILTVTIWIALLMASCNPQSSPTPRPVGPQDGPTQMINPGDNQPGGPLQDGPQQGGPGGGQPGGVQIDFRADGMMLQPGQCTNLHWNVQGAFSVRLDGQPVDPNGQRQVCPNATTTYRLEADAGDRVEMREVTIQVEGGNPPAPTQKTGGGPGPASTPTVKSVVPAATATPQGRIILTVLPLKIYDIALTKVFLDTGNGTIMAQIKNTGTMTWDGNLTLTCTGDWRTCDVCAYATAVTTQSLNLDVGDTVNVSTGLYDNPALSKQYVACTMTNVTDDAISTNNAIGSTKVK
jgi:hypothetical protein